MNPVAVELLKQADWNELRTVLGVGTDVPAALVDLADAPDKESADRAYWNLDNIIVVQGQLYTAAIAALPVLVGMLIGPLSPSVRVRTADLLFEIGTGTTDKSEVQFGRDLGAEARAGLSGAMWMLYGLAFDADVRVAKTALQLAFVVDTDRRRLATVLTGLTRTACPAAGFAGELLAEQSG